MSKFVMECPNCGNYVEAKKGFFAKKKLDCACGFTIDVKTDKMTSRACPHCGNEVVFDQSKGSSAKCPVCKEPINTMEEQSNMTEFSCEQCGIRLRTAKTAATYTCPVCDHVNDVAERVQMEKIKHEGLPSVIKYEGDNNTFVWKHPIEDFYYGSQLIVHESQEAIFFKDGQALDLFGPGRYTLTTQQLPFLGKFYKLPTSNEGVFHAEVYFINKTVQMAFKWGLPEKVRFIDPLTGVPLELGVSGSINMQVSNSRSLLVNLVGTMKGISWGGEDEKENPKFTKSIQASFRPLITNVVKSNLSAIIRDEAIDLLEIDEKIDIISERLRVKIAEGFEEYGLTTPQFYVNNIVLPEDDPNFKRIRDLHTITLQTRMAQAEATVKTAQAQSKAQYRTAEEQSRAAIEAARREAELEEQTTETEIAKREAERKVIAAQADAQAQRIEGLTEAEIMKAKGYNQKDVLQADVQKAFAEGIGNMGPDVSAGGGGGSILGDVLGLGVGLAAAGTIAPQLGGLFGAISPAGANADAFAQTSSATPADTWTCSCGQTGITSKFCPECGSPKPAPADTWICPNCGAAGITSKFCPECGTKKPEKAAGWTCPNCGKTDIESKFCPDCGAKKGE